MSGGVTTVQPIKAGHNANLQFNVAIIKRNADPSIVSNNVDISCVYIRYKQGLLKHPNDMTMSKNKYAWKKALQQLNC
jgi:hypothetical protein